MLYICRGMLKAYKYRLLPTEDQQKTLIQWMGACRYVYNLGLETKMIAWTSLRKNVTCFDLIKQLTDLKRADGMEWLRACSSQSLESALTNLDNAYTSFFRGGGFPKFKKRSGRQSITFRRDTRIEKGFVRLTKLPLIAFAQHRPLPEGSEIRSTTVSKTPSGAWFISFLIQDNKNIPAKRPITIEGSVGIDVGLKAFATLSDGQVFDNPKYLHHQLKRLRIEQRTLRRRYKKGIPIKEQSKGYYRQRIVVAKLHEKIANQRKDFLHKLTDSITKNYDTICLENLNVQGMMQNKILSKAIGDVSWHEFIRQLEYKAEWRGKNISFIGRFEPSSKLCSVCGHHFKELKLSNREWDCEKCGAHHERDRNAAINIKNFGLRKQPVSGKASQ